jgi:hypothetical protein
MIAMAPGIAEVVRYAGGWLVDQVLAGWDVTVITAAPADEPADARALRILGVRGCRLDDALKAPLAGPCLEAVALRADMYAGDERIRRLVRIATETNDAEIRLWGDVWPDDFDAQAGPVEHELSRAARAFKAQALTAASAAHGHAAMEVFRRGELRRPALAAVR